MKILHLHRLPCFGGAEKSILYLADAQRPMGIEHVVVTRRDGEFLPQLKLAGIEWHIFDFERACGHLLERRGLDYWLQLRRLVNEVRPDIIHICSSSCLRRTWLLPCFTHVPVIVQFHEALLDDRVPPIAREALELFAGVVCVSGCVKDSLGKVPGSVKCRVVYNGVVVPPLAGDKERSRQRAILGFQPEDIVVLDVANFYRCKQHETFIRAAALLRDTPHLRLLVLGSPSDQAYFQEVCDLNRELDARVQFTGFQQDVAPWLIAADMTVLCSNEDACPLFLAEAMAFGKPVIGARAGGIPELVEDGESGFLFEVGDASALAGQIRRMAERPDVRAAMGRAGRERAQRLFSLQRHAEEMADVYKEAQRANGRARLARGAFLARTLAREGLHTARHWMRAMALQ